MQNNFLMNFGVNTCLVSQFFQRPIYQDHTSMSKSWYQTNTSTYYLQTLKKEKKNGLNRYIEIRWKILEHNQPEWVSIWQECKCCVTWLDAFDMSSQSLPLRNELGFGRCVFHITNGLGFVCESIMLLQNIPKQNFLILMSQKNKSA